MYNSETNLRMFALKKAASFKTSLSRPDDDNELSRFESCPLHKESNVVQQQKSSGERIRRKSMWHKNPDNFKSTYQRSRDIFTGKLDFKNTLRQFNPKDEERHRSRTEMNNNIDDLMNFNEHKGRNRDGLNTLYSMPHRPSSPRRVEFADQAFNFSSAADNVNVNCGRIIKPILRVTGLDISSNSATFNPTTTYQSSVSTPPNEKTSPVTICITKPDSEKTIDEVISDASESDNEEIFAMSDKERRRHRSADGVLEKAPHFTSTLEKSQNNSISSLGQLFSSSALSPTGGIFYRIKPTKQ